MNDPDVVKVREALFEEGRFPLIDESNDPPRDVQLCFCGRLQGESSRAHSLNLQLIYTNVHLTYAVGLAVCCQRFPGSRQQPAEGPFAVRTAPSNTPQQEPLRCTPPF